MIKKIAVGVIAGFISGLFAAGGGMIVVPAFIHIFKLNEAEARATSVFAILPMVITSGLLYYNNNYIDWNIGVKCAIGGIIGGIFTATEGAAIAVVYSLLLSMLFYKSIKIKDLPRILLESINMTAMIVFLIGVSSIMSWVLAFTNVPTYITQLILGISDNPIVILLIMNILLLVVGTFMDLTPAILIFTPIFLPIAQNLGMDTIQFGIMLVFNLCIGTITPPVGNTLFVGCRVAKTKIEGVIKNILPFYVSIFVVLMLVTFIPSISLFLPRVMGILE